MTKTSLPGCTVHFTRKFVAERIRKIIGYLPRARSPVHTGLQGVTAYRLAGLSVKLARLQPDLADGAAQPVDVISRAASEVAL